MTSTCVTDKSLELLARNLATLKHLDVSGSQVSEGGIVKFRERRPECQLMAEPSAEEQASDGEVVKDKEEEEGGVGEVAALNDNCDS